MYLSRNNDVAEIAKGELGEIKQQGGNTIDLANYRTL
jgi:hypothetical protein